MDLRVGILALLLAKSGHKLDKAPVVLYLLLGLACLLLFLLFGHLGNLPSYFLSTGQGTVEFTYKQAAGYFQGGQSLHSTLAYGSLILQGRACQEHNLIFWNDAL